MQEYLRTIIKSEKILSKVSWQCHQCKFLDLYDFRFFFQCSPELSRLIQYGVVGCYSSFWLFRNVFSLRLHLFETILWPTYSNKPFNVICRIHIEDLGLELTGLWLRFEYFLLQTNFTWFALQRQRLLQRQIV